MKTTTQPKASEREVHEPRRIRGASEVLSILQPQQSVDPVVLPTGLWKTGSLPKPQGAAS